MATQTEQPKVMVLAEAMFRSGLSDPYSDGADREWEARKYRVGYREGQVLKHLDEAGFALVERDA